MKLVAFGCGRKNGNTEVFIKEALMAAEEKGLEVEYVRLADFDIHNCSSCYQTFCPANRNIDNCRYHDDTKFIAEKYLDADGVIVGAPVYAYTPDSLFFTFRDRVFGPKMDIACEHVGFPEPEWIQGRRHPRPGALISVGGAMTKHWTSLGVASLYSSTFSIQTEIVDILDAYGVADLGAACLNEEWLAKAHKLGENVADAILSGDWFWRGDADEDGRCPECHCYHLTREANTNKVTCPVCGSTGYLKAVGDKITVEWPDTEECRKESRMRLSGKIMHLTEIEEVKKELNPVREKGLALLEKYKAYNACEVKPPLKI